MRLHSIVSKARRTKQVREPKAAEEKAEEEEAEGKKHVSVRGHAGHEAVLA